MSRFWQITLSSFAGLLVQDNALQGVGSKNIVSPLVLRLDPYGRFFVTE
jgi:hypothetical protein